MAALTLAQLEQRLDRGEALGLDGQRALVKRLRQVLAERDAANARAEAAEKAAALDPVRWLNEARFPAGRR